MPSSESFDLDIGSSDFAVDSRIVVVAGVDLSAQSGKRSDY